jgi:hypothetical protein
MYALTWVADFHMLSLIHMLTHCALVNIRAWYRKSQYKLICHLKKACIFHLVTNSTVSFVPSLQHSREDTIQVAIL